MKSPLPWLVAAATPTLIAALTIDIDHLGGNASSPLQYGIFFEQINHGGDGGIYAELIRNRAFQFGSALSNATTDPWSPINAATLSIDSQNPLTSALPFSINVARGPAPGNVGLTNPGWYGIDVRPQLYTGSFYTFGHYSGDFQISLHSALNDDVFASISLPSESVDGMWTQHNFTLTPPAPAPNSNNSFSISFDPAATPSGALQFQFISLMPPTWYNRPNGMRIDLMHALAQLNPSFLRIPGGNNLEGNTFADRWQWRNTIGPLVDRPGRFGAWTYINTDGLGLAEVLDWCQDLDAEPVLAVYAGHSLDNTSVAQPDLQPFIDDALDELEYVLGDASTTYGALRVAHGHPDPWKVHYVEIGNEDQLTQGLDSYRAYRFQMFSSAITAAYPSMNIISSTNYLSPFAPSPSIAGDFHEYTRPDDFVSQFNLFDQNYTWAAKTFIGEYAVVQPNSPSTGPRTTDWSEPLVAAPFWAGTVAEAVFLLGAERNAGSTLGASYAPLLQNLNDYQWAPDLVSFTADPAQDVRSTSWHLVALFSGTRFTETRATRSAGPDAGFGPVYWAAGQNTDTGAYVLKLASYNASASTPVSAAVAGLAPGTPANLTVLTAPDAYASARIGSDPVVYTHTSLVAGPSGVFTFELPDLAIALLVTSNPAEEAALAARAYGQYPGFGGYGGCKGGQPRGSVGGFNIGFGGGNGC